MKRGIQNRAKLVTDLKSAELTIAKLNAKIVDLENSITIFRKTEEKFFAEKKELEMRLAEARRRTVSTSNGLTDFNFLPLEILGYETHDSMPLDGQPYWKVTILARDLTAYRYSSKEDTAKAALKTIARIATENAK